MNNILLIEADYETFHLARKWLRHAFALLHKDGIMYVGSSREELWKLVLSDLDECEKIAAQMIEEWENSIEKNEEPG